MEDNYMKITDSKGNITSYRIICAFINEKTEKNYIVYTDDEYDENENLNIYASIYYPDDDTKLDEVTTDEEWEAIENVLSTLESGE